MVIRAVATWAVAEIRLVTTQLMVIRAVATWAVAEIRLVTTQLMVIRALATWAVAEIRLVTTQLMVIRAVATWIVASAQLVTARLMAAWAMAIRTVAAARAIATTQAITVLLAVGVFAGCSAVSPTSTATSSVVLAELDVAAIRARHPTSLFDVPPAAARAEIHKAIDGDTVAATFPGGQTENVRLIGIDTPEKPGGYLPAECFGAEATAFTEALLPPGTPVLLTGGAEPRDIYDRLLAYVHRATDGLLVNMALAREGYADTLSIAPNTDYSAQFAAAVAAARAENLGLWAACGGPDTPVES